MVLVLQFSQMLPLFLLVEVKEEGPFGAGDQNGFAGTVQITWTHVVSILEYSRTPLIRKLRGLSVNLCLNEVSITFTSIVVKPLKIYSMLGVK